jgi:hypothetical protein
MMSAPLSVAQAPRNPEHATVQETFGARVGAYLVKLREAQEPLPGERSPGWSQERAAAMIREETKTTLPSLGTYRMWEREGDISIVDLAIVLRVLGGSLEELANITANGEQHEGEQPEQTDPVDGSDHVADPRERGTTGGLQRRRSSKRGARQARRDPT